MTTLEENAGPVNDPKTDYNIFDPEYVRDPYPTMHEIRESKCPIAHSNRWGGSWLPTRYEDVVAIAQEHEIFTSRDIIVVPRSAAAAEGPYAAVAAPPITSDPPDHHWHRRLILPVFAPQSVAKYEQSTRELCNQLIDRFIAKGEADAGTDYAQQIPVRVIATMLGVPVDMADEFTGWVRGVLEVGLTDPKVRLESRLKILNFFRGQLDDRKKNPRENDLITELLNSGDKYPVTDQYVLGVCNLMLVAGIDTTWSAIGSSLWHLAQHPEHRRQLRDNPDLWPTAIEELLRAYSPVTMARVATEDVELQGCPIKAGEKVLLNFPAANRDPEVFERPDEVDFDRPENRHVAFGAGIHRCAGANLARMELRVAIEEWLRRIPEFRLEPGTEVTWAGGQVRGPRTCPVVF